MWTGNKGIVFSKRVYGLFIRPHQRVIFTALIPLHNNIILLVSIMAAHIGTATSAALLLFFNLLFEYSNWKSQL